MTIPELNQKLDSLVNDITQNLGTTMVQVGSEALVYVRERVMNSGIDAEGQKYEPYSTRPMLANCSSMTGNACSRIASSKEKRKELKWVTIKRGDKNIRLFELPQGYKQYRELHGKQTGFVDFSFSGRMWSNIKIKSDQSEHNSGIVRIGATTEEDNKKLEGNTKRRGDILKLSKSEIENIKSSFAMNITQSIERAGLK